MYYDHDSMYGGHNKVQNKTKQKHEYSIITPKSIHVYVFNNDTQKKCGSGENSAWFEFLKTSVPS